MNSRSKGIVGENLAADYLSRAGYTLITRNFRSMWGEIDIIASFEDVLVFIEVKAWSQFSAENLEYAITKQKQQRIIKTAKFFLASNRKYNSMAIRFDIIFIGQQGVTHLASAFMESIL
ncbi:MAG: YraN family protein [Termitinemataceae bacterium]